MSNQKAPPQKKVDVKPPSATWIKALVEKSPSGIYAINDQKKIIYVNPKMSEIFGYSEDEFLGQNFQMVLTAESLNFVTERYEQRQRGEKVPSTYQFTVRCKNGAEKLVEVSGNIILDEYGSHVTIGNVTDKTWMREAEEHLKRYEQIISATDDKMSYLDKNYVYKAVNQAYLNVHQKDYSEIVGHSVAELFGQDLFHNTVKEKLDRCLAGEQIRYESWFDFPQIGKRYMEVHYQPYRNENGDIDGVIVSSHDITEREQARLKLDQQKKTAQLYLDIAGVMLGALDKRGHIILMNKKGHKILGYQEGELIGKNWFDLCLPPAISQEIKAVFNQQMTGAFEPLEFYENAVLTKAGKERFIAFHNTLLHDENGRSGVLFSGEDITERKQLDRQLRESEEKFRLAFMASPDAVNLNRLSDGVYVDINDSFTQMMGYTRDDVVGLSSLELNIWKNEEDRNRLVRELQAKGSVTNLEAEFVAKNGDVHSGLMSAQIIEIDGEEIILSITRDITAMKKAEEERLRFEKQMIQTQKFESLGVLAGGVAHDFNNLLAAIMGHSELAKRRLPAESPILGNLRQIEQGAERAADLAKQMLAYSGRGKFVTTTIDLNLLLEEMLHMMKVSISKKAVLRLNPYTPLPAIEVDATQLRQIIMNLVINASEAIGNKSGVITLSTGCMDCDQSYLKNVWLNENLKDGLYVYLEVADTGCGMDQETMAKLFDPFFTTKFTGRGLGMSAVMGIVRGHKGAIKVYSEPDKGTTFKILLPASEKPAEIFNGVTEDDGWKGSGKVLLVDDEESVRGIGLEMLKELGFNPITAIHGLDALQVYKDNPDIILVIMDLTMPKMDGEQCYRELRKLCPDIKVIMSSGYNDLEVSQRFVGKGIAGFVQKPYKLSVLRDVIKIAIP